MAVNASVGVRTDSPAYQAYQILHLAFVVALRDLGLALGAFALSRLAMEFDRRG
jgi:hypothetical protein